MKYQFTLKNLLALMVVVALLCGLVVSMILPARQQARVQECADNMRQIGQGLHNYHDVTRFPSGSEEYVSALVPGAVKAGGDLDPHYGTGSVSGTWSWSSRILPFINHKVIYDQIEFESSLLSGRLGGEHMGPHPMDFNLGISCTEIDTFRCPGYTGPKLAQAYLPKDQPASTNYVALGATTYYRLWGKDSSQPPDPDGAFYPKSRTRFRDFIDGATNTIVIAETIEPNWSAWADGVSASTFALGSRTIDASDFVKAKAAGTSYLNLSPTATTAVTTTMELGPSQALIPAAELPFGVNPATVDTTKAWLHGPSSEHPYVVNHLFADGAVRGMRRDIDATVYMHLVTMRGGEPVKIKQIFGE